MSRTLSASVLVRLVRKKGGIRLGKDGHTIEVRDCPDHLRKLLKREEYGVRAWLREEWASYYWQKHCSWSYYPRFTTPVSPSCRCSAYDFPHIHNDAGPPVNCELEGDVFDELKTLLS